MDQRAAIAWGVHTSAGTGVSMRSRGSKLRRNAKPRRISDNRCAHKATTRSSNPTWPSRTTGNLPLDPRASAASIRSAACGCRVFGADELQRRGVGALPVGSGEQLQKRSQVRGLPDFIQGRDEGVREDHSASRRACVMEGPRKHIPVPVREAAEERRPLDPRRCRVPGGRGAGRPRWAPRRLRSTPAGNARLDTRRTGLARFAWPARPTPQSRGVGEKRLDRQGQIGRVRPVLQDHVAELLRALIDVVLVGFFTIEPSPQRG